MDRTKGIERMLNQVHKFDYRHIICVLITIGFIVCGHYLFPHAVGRIIEAFRDFGLSVGYYFCELFGIPHNIIPTVNDLPKIPFFTPSEPIPPIDPSVPTPPAVVTPITPVLPDDFEMFKADWISYWQLCANVDNFKGYMSWIGNVLFIGIKVMLPFSLIFILLLVLCRSYFDKTNTKRDKDSVPLMLYRKLSNSLFLPVKCWIVSMIEFVKENRYYYLIWLCLWAFYFNLITIVVEFFAFYFYFALSFDVVNIYRQVYKLFMDLSVMFTFIPLWVWLFVGLYMFNRFRRKIGLSVQRHNERCNRGFINELPIVSMACGSMGKRKTTIITDMALSQEVLFRNKAFEMILENDLKFPNFPWINLEDSIKLAMRYGYIYNLATCKQFIRKKARRFNKCPCSEKIFGYDYKHYGRTYDDKLKVVDIWEVLEIYTQLYFIYVIQSSLLVSNYSIRVDNVLSDLGNFPIWNTDFFSRDSRLMDSYSRHAHIIDYDCLRLGVKMVKNNAKANAFEFGVIIMTEVGKERGNNLSLQETKKKDDTANQKNDLFNAWLKMSRHSASVDNFPFIKIFTDEQRPESWGADARDLCEIIHIKECGETRLTMPFFALEELIHAVLYNKFVSLYSKYRYNRGDNTLFMYFLKYWIARLHHYYVNTYNQFGISKLSLQVESGTQDGNFDKKKYYLMSKKVYSKRFSTDCFSDFFTVKALNSAIGLDDLVEYCTERATIYELQIQNSYFVMELITGFINNQGGDTNE